MTTNFSSFAGSHSVGGHAQPSQKRVQPLGQSNGRPGVYRNGAKRLLDVLLTLMSAPIVVPMIAILAAMIAFEGGKPFYSQLRVGRNGRVFRMWKMRTMIQNADDRLEEYLLSHPEKRLEWDETQKLRNDPRITRLGRFLRKSSIDELPQLWNVLIGEMSLVGPRPMMVNQQSLYPSKSYYALRPGLTGYWQTSARNESTFAERAGYDDAYERELSFATDLALIYKTVGVVLRAGGM